ncbi:MAG TPA: ubiquitin-like domain-containing protein, partial [Nakamurella sp.]
MTATDNSTDIFEPIAEGSETEFATTPVKTGRSLRKPVLVGAAAAAVVVAMLAGGGVAMAAHKDVTVTVDGQIQDVGTFSGSVEGALDAAGVAVGEHDTVAPDLSTAISDGSQIVVAHGRLLTLTIDGQTREVWTTATTVEEALAELGQDPSAYQLSADRSRAIPLDGLAVTADTLFNTTVTDGTGPATAVTTAGKNVGDLLNKAGIAVGPLDIVNVPAETPLSNGLSVTITRVAQATVTEDVEVAQPADQTVEDSSVEKGVSSVTQQGSAGKDSVTYEVTTANGAETAKTEVSRTAITPAQATIRSVGTK